MAFLPGVATNAVRCEEPPGGPERLAGSSLAHHLEPLLRLGFRFIGRRCRELQHGGALAEDEIVEPYLLAIRQFQRVMVQIRIAEIDLTEDADAGRMRDFFRYWVLRAFTNGLGERDFRSRQHADSLFGGFRGIGGGKPARIGVAELRDPQFVAHNRWARSDQTQAIVADDSLLYLRLLLRSLSSHPRGRSFLGGRKHTKMDSLLAYS